MRILIVTPLVPPEPGGPSYYSVALKEALEKAGHTTDLIAFKEVRQYPSGVRHLIFLYKVLFRAFTADTLIILDTVSVALPAVIAGWLLGKKTIIRTGGDFVWEAYVERTKEKVKLSEFYTAPRLLTKKERTLVWLQKNIIFRMATMVVFSTVWQRDIWRAPYGIPDAKTAVIANAHGVTPVQKSAPKGKGASSPQTSPRHIFLWVGRDTALKNVDALTRSFARVKERHAHAELVLLSGVPREEVEAAFRTARCLVLPSVSEVSPNLVYEALAYGVPVVCTADTGIREDAPAGVVFVDTLDEQKLAEAMVGMYDDRVYMEMCKALTTRGVARTYEDIAGEFCTLLA